jgi:catechol 2,3-dioxygenase-like lactoylglutathione lyase family enzyme
VEFEFHHVHLRCEDLDAAVDFYENVLNGKITERVALGGMPIVRMEVGGQRLFLSPKFGDINVEPTSGEARWGVYQLALLVDDIDTAVEELKARGAEPQNIKPSGMPIAFFTGPDNVQIELMQRS